MKKHRPTSNALGISVLTASVESLSVELSSTFALAVTYRKTN